VWEEASDHSHIHVATSIRVYVQRLASDTPQKPLQLGVATGQCNKKKETMSLSGLVCESLSYTSIFPYACIQQSDSQGNLGSHKLPLHAYHPYQLYLRKKHTYTVWA
jgi:hypothetical protein